MPPCQASKQLLDKGLLSSFNGLGLKLIRLMVFLQSYVLHVLLMIASFIKCTLAACVLPLCAYHMVKHLARKQMVPELVQCL